MSSTITTLLVDDETAGRRRLRRLLASEPDIAVVGEASNGIEAVAAIVRLRPQLLFLDVEMPGLDGLGLARQLGEARPVTIFVTAHEQYALQAFDVDAADYLLKPFDHARLRRALIKTRAAVQQLSGRAGRFASLIGLPPRCRRYDRRVASHIARTVYALLATGAVALTQRTVVAPTMPDQMGSDRTSA
jgi:two-component system LytT family response regulator